MSSSDINIEEEAHLQDILKTIMNHVDGFAEALNKCKKKEVRQEFLNKALNNLITNHSVIFMDVVGDLEKRHMNAMSWTDVPTDSVSLEEVHKSLMMLTAEDVRGNEKKLKAKLEALLAQSIHYKTNRKMSLKICDVLEINPFLSTIYKSLSEPIEITRTLFTKHQEEETMASVELRKIMVEEDKQQNPSLKSDYYERIENSPEMRYYKYLCRTRVGMIDTPILGRHQEHVDEKPTNIVMQKMDGEIADWLDYLQIAKYQWFFNSLSYGEIVSLDRNNIKSTISNVNRLQKNGNSIKKGIQERICAAAAELKFRSLNVGHLIADLDGNDRLCSVADVNKHVKYMRIIVHYPVPNELCCELNSAQFYVSNAMESIFKSLMRRLRDIDVLKGRSMLASVVKKYYECLTVVARNQAFKPDVILKMEEYAYKLTARVNAMRRDFDFTCNYLQLTRSTPRLRMDDEAEMAQLPGSIIADLPIGTVTENAFHADGVDLDNDYVRIVVSNIGDRGGRKLYHFRPTMCLKILLDLYCFMSVTEKRRSRFLFRGYPIRDYDTAQSLGMRDGSVIQALKLP